MSFHLRDEQDQGMSEINLIPLIDIMLVLMIIFLVTATVTNPGVRVNLPEANNQPIAKTPEVVTITIDAQGVIHWNQEVVSLDEAGQRMVQAAKAATKPTLHLRTDRNAKYDTLAQIMARANQAGITDLAFISQPLHH